MARRRNGPGRQGSRGALAAVWLLASLVMIVVPLGVVLTRRGPMLNGHPVTLVVAFALVLLGTVAAICAVVVLIDRVGRLRKARSASPADREAAAVPRRRWPVAVTVPVLVITLGATAFLAWSRPFGADPVAVQALSGDNGVRVDHRLTSYALVPTREDRTGKAIPVTTGLVFYPGARVDDRAYAAVLRPLAEDGYLVVVVKEPFGIGLLDPGAARRIPALYPQITRWAVGGHSLGGIPAATVADDDRTFTGLVFYASEPAGALERSDLRVLSVSGTNAGLAPPERIAASRSRLPADATTVVVQGGVHAYFGDYGPQPGDGVPTASRAKAQQQIAGVTAKFLAGLPAGAAAAGAATATPRPSASPTR